MNTTIPIIIPDLLPTTYQWDNLVIEKRISLNWLYKIWDGSIFHDIWILFASPVN